MKECFCEQSHPSFPIQEALDRSRPFMAVQCGTLTKPGPERPRLVWHRAFVAERMGKTRIVIGTLREPPHWRGGCEIRTARLVLWRGEKLVCPGNAIFGWGSCFGHASAERGREASWYAFQRKALERGGMGMAEIGTKPAVFHGGAAPRAFERDRLAAKAPPWKTALPNPNRLLFPVGNRHPHR